MSRLAFLFGREGFARRHRKALVRRLEAVYKEREFLVGLCEQNAAVSTRLEEAIRAHDDAQVPSWSPLTEYAPGTRVRLPSGEVVSVAYRKTESGGIAREYHAPRTRREAFGHDAPLETGEGLGWGHALIAFAAASAIAILAAKVLL